jgi:hypothetical protein
MLEIATSACSRQATWSFSPCRTWLKDGNNISASKRLIKTGDLHLDDLTRDRMSNKDHGAFVTGDEMSPVGDLLNLHPQNLPDMERFSL